jgi:hypothetical protein
MSRRTEPQTRRALAPGLFAWARRRKWPLLATLASVATGTVFSFVWLPITQTGRFAGYWLVPGDIWGVYRSAHYIGWGGYGDIYGAVTGFISFPGILVLYAPVAMLTGALGLGEDFPYVLAHPTAWLVLGPYSLLIGSSVLFALDSLAERLCVPKGRRIALCFAEAAILWIVDARMGHPEDALALALAVHALLAFWSGRTRRSGWLFGLAVVMQPLVLLMLPLIVFQTERGQRMRTVMRCVVPSAVALFVPLVSDWRDTTRSLVEQPFPLAFAHITPWTSWAPRAAADIVPGGAAVTGGPGRVLALLVCVAIGWWSMHRRLGLAEMLWIAALCLAFRTVFDSALASYYPWPPMALVLVVAATRGRTRFAFTAVCAFGVTVVASWHFGPWWAWWLLVVGGLGFTLLTSKPTAFAKSDDTTAAQTLTFRPRTDQPESANASSDASEELVISS